MGPALAPIGARLLGGGWLDRWRVGIGAAVLLVMQVVGLTFFVIGTHGWVVPVTKPTTTDFVSFYAAGRLADAGSPALAYDRAAHRAAEERATGPGINYEYFNYPPVYILPFTVLARLPYLVAFVLFEAATLALYLFVGARILGERSGAALCALGAVPIVFWNVGLGQNGFLTAALFGAATLIIDRRPVAAGLLFGALCYKPQFGLLLPLALAAAGEWRAFAAAAAAVAALVLLSLALFGVATWQAFLGTAAASHALYESGQILFGGMANTFGAARLVGLGVTLAYALQALVSLAAAGAVVIVWRRPLPLPTRAAVLASAALVAAPLSLLYDLLLGVVAAAWLVRGRDSPAAAGWEKNALALLYLAILGGPRFFANWRVPVYSLAALALFALAAGRARRELALRAAMAGTGSPRARTGESRAAPRARSRPGSPAR
jgi:Glycosyltransferase family 87